MSEYRMCTRCIMTSRGDRSIRFDKNGYCNYCTDGLKKLQNKYFPNEEGEKKLKEAVEYLKAKNKDKEFDCLMGISGGLDSCYLAYLGAMKWGLRIAAIHIDDGFDTEVCKSNIAKLCEKCGIRITCIMPNSHQYYELCRAFMLAGVPSLDVPQDNILFSNIYKYALEHDVCDFLSGENYSLESILQIDNVFSAYDVKNILAINEKFGRDRLDKLDLLNRKQIDLLVKKVNSREYKLLNYIDYNREKALKELNEFCGFEYYGSKHLENYYTGFLQLYWYPQKFDVDKRTSHLSSMIISGQMTREEAIRELEKPCSSEWLEQSIKLIKEKLDFTDEEFEKVMLAKTHKHTDFAYEIYPYWKSIFWRWCHNKGLV